MTTRHPRDWFNNSWLIDYARDKGLYFRQVLPLIKSLARRTGKIHPPIKPRGSIFNAQRSPTQYRR